ncbi:hypothetical protein L1987_29083 [Smallanthus sonchifolius]|uniref:Uncharacterized protein n=1 Tax=Smallanthus sonchifolius TaxID=185202 RepID=A0ACB9HZU4_9ASTR|nr:hypothetical protein L1987_29083 [Smallanthus sonchifolius]
MLQHTTSDILEAHTRRIRACYLTCRCRPSTSTRRHSLQPQTYKLQQLCLLDSSYIVADKKKLPLKL